MSKNWEFAPSDAEKYNLANGYYYKGVRPNLFVHIDGDWTDSVLMAKNEQFVYRPVQPKPWSGPEDGLPPVGSIVQLCGVRTIALDEYDADEHCIVDTWKNGDPLEVLAHRNVYGTDAIIVFNTTKMQASSLMAKLYKPIKAPEQIAADNRETAIRELMDIAQVDCRVTAARLVDAGFKREVV